MKRMGEIPGRDAVDGFRAVRACSERGAAEIPPSESASPPPKKLLGEYPDVENFTEEETRKGRPEVRKRSRRFRLHFRFQATPSEGCAQSRTARSA